MAHRHPNPPLLLLAATVAGIFSSALAVQLKQNTPGNSNSGQGDQPEASLSRPPRRLAEVHNLPSNVSGYGSSSGGGSEKTQGAGTNMPRLSGDNDLRYFQGPLITSAAPVHVIYYGDWRSRSVTVNAVRSFVKSISASWPTGAGSVSAWWALNRLLYQKDGKRATNQVFLKSEHWDWYSQGKTLQQDLSAIFNVIKRYLDLKQIVHTPGAMYFVLTSPDVRVGSGDEAFCTQYCGWHDYYRYKNQDIYFSFVGDGSTQCPANCGMSMRSPSGATDAVIDTFAHEIAEIATDPDVMTGWLTSQAEWGQENADICRSQYLNLKTWTNQKASYKYNLQGVNGAKFLVQANYNPVTARCAMLP